MIKRSTGTMVTVGSIPYIVGGGYEGKTSELDSTVQKASELLSSTFNRNIEIRFNSHRESGGAFLVNSLKGFAGNSQIGLCAGIAIEGHYCHKILDVPIGGIYVATNVDQTALKHPEICNSGTDDDRYCYLYHANLETAIKWLIDNIDSAKIEP